MLELDALVLVLLGGVRFVRRVKMTARLGERPFPFKGTCNAGSRVRKSKCESRRYKSAGVVQVLEVVATAVPMHIHI